MDFKLESLIHNHIQRYTRNTKKFIEFPCFQTKIKNQNTKKGIELGFEH